MSLTQFCFSVREAEAGLRSSPKKEAVGWRRTLADPVCGQSGLWPVRRRTAHGSRFTAEVVRRPSSPSAPSGIRPLGNQLTSTQVGGILGVVGSTNEPATVTVDAQPATTPASAGAPFPFQGTTTAAGATTTFKVTAVDGAGNTRTNTYQVTGVTGNAATLTYDENGNLTQKAEGADTWVYVWDAENRLKEVKKNAATQATFRYDPSDRRVEKVAAGVTLRFVYDNEDWIRRTTTSGTTMDIVHGPGIDEPLAQDVGGTMTYFHADALGSIQKHTNFAGAVVVAQTVEYDAWGNALVGTPGPYAFTGREPDAETGLQYYRARYYDSKLARFISEDPISLAGGINMYGYALSNPAWLGDPSGLAACAGGPPCGSGPNDDAKEACNQQSNPDVPPGIRKCLKEKCEGGFKLFCHPEGSCPNDKTRNPDEPFGVSHRASDVHICSPTGSPCQQKNTILHEMMHSCLTGPDPIVHQIINPIVYKIYPCGPKP